MTRRYPLALALALSAAAFVATSPAGAQKNKPLSDVPGSFTIRTGLDPDGTNQLGDRVTGDFWGDYAADPDGTNVKLNGNREFRAELYGSRFLQLDFLEQVVGPLCGTNCFRTWERLLIPQPNTYPRESPFRVFMQTNVVTAGNTETADGLMGLPINDEPGYARFYFTFKDPGGGDFHWSVLFNPAEYPGSQLIRVARTATCSWTLYAPAGTQAGLRAWAVLKGKDNSSNEGRFAMPFELTFTAPNCGA